MANQLVRPKAIPNPLTEEEVEEAGIKPTEPIPWEQAINYKLSSVRVNTIPQHKNKQNKMTMVGPSDYF